MPPISRKKILLVDDTATIISLEKLLLGDSYEYVVARNGREAIDRASADAPDLILMDLNMPIMGGMDALRELKAEPKTTAIPVVIVTTRGEPESIEMCKKLGCTDLVVKPIEGERLVSTVRRILES